MFFIPYYGSDGRLFPILSVGWTLVLEVYGYIVFWALYKILKKRKHRDSITAVLFAFLVHAGKILNMYYPNMPILVIWSYKYQWAFLIGILLSICKDYKRKNHRSETVDN